MLAQTDFLTERDGQPVAVENTDGRSPVLLVCEHASLRLPATVGTLGAGMYGEATSYQKTANTETLCIPMIETKTAIKNLDAILEPLKS